MGRLVGRSAGAVARTQPPAARVHHWQRERALAPALGVTFVLTNVGWLLFREQNIHELVRQLTVNPFTASADDWRIGGFFVVLMAITAFPSGSMP